jgi:hypothetical protein
METLVLQTESWTRDDPARPPDLPSFEEGLSVFQRRSEGLTACLPPAASSLADVARYTLLALPR